MNLSQLRPDLHFFGTSRPVNSPFVQLLLVVLLWYLGHTF
jgi:hypothetical protein